LLPTRNEIWGGVIMSANPNAFDRTRDAPATESKRSSAQGTKASVITLLEHRRTGITELVPASLRHDMISLAAYYRSAERNFATGYELEDWLAAEREVDATLRARYAY
jgi:hypothetical protein